MHHYKGVLKVSLAFLQKKTNGKHFHKVLETHKTYLRTDETWISNVEYVVFLDGNNFCKAFAGALVNMSYHKYDKFTCAPAKPLQKLSPSRKTTYSREIVVFCELT